MNYIKEVKSRLNNYEDLYIFSKINLENIVKNCNRKLVFRICHILLNNNIDYAIYIINKLEYDDYSFLSLKINIFSKKKDKFSEALKILEYIKKNKKNMIKKRIYMPILNSYIKWYPEKSFNFLLEISKMFRLNYENIKYFLSTYCNKELLFNIISNHNIKLKNNSFSNTNDMNIITFSPNNNNLCTNCNNKLGKVNLTEKERNGILNNFKKEYLKNKKHLSAINQMDEFCKNKNYNVFIDGANIMYFFKRKINIQSYKRLLYFYNYMEENGYKPLVILHQRHKKSVKNQYTINNILNFMNVYYTPYHMNDDYFFIWQSLNTQNSLILTNDKFTDHIFNISEENLVSNTLQKWMNNSIITYNTFESNKNINVDFKFPNEISPIAQKNNEHWHLPTSDNKWFCIKL